MYKYKGINNEFIDNVLFEKTLSKTKATGTSILIVGKGSDTKKYLVYHLIQKAIEIYGSDNIQLIETRNLSNAIGNWDNKESKFKESKIDKSKIVNIVYIPQAESHYSFSADKSIMRSFNAIENNIRHIKHQGHVIFIFTTRAALHNDVKRSMHFIFYHDTADQQIYKYFPVELESDYHYFVDLLFSEFSESCGYKIEPSKINIDQINNKLSLHN